LAPMLSNSRYMTMPPMIDASVKSTKYTGTTCEVPKSAVARFRRDVRPIRTKLRGDLRPTVGGWGEMCAQCVPGREGGRDDL